MAAIAALRLALDCAQSLARSGQALRTLRRAPGYTTLVVLTLSLGIALTTAMFSVVDAVVLNPLPFPKAQRAIDIWVYFSEGASRAPAAMNAVADSLRQESTLFESVEAYQTGSATLTGHGDPDQIGFAGLSPGLFRMFPVAPLAGRLFSDSDATSGERVIVIADRLWASRFGRDPNAIGRVLTIEDQDYRIIGVLPTRFRFPTASVEAWRPINMGPGVKPARMTLIGVRRPDVSDDLVTDRLKTLTVALTASGALPKGQYLVAQPPLGFSNSASSVRTLYLLFGAVGVLLLVTAVNVSSVMLVRASVRNGELSVRTALGAGRALLMREATFEAVWLSLASGIIGLLLASGLVRLILGLVPPQLAMLERATGDLDLRSAAFGLGLAALTTMLSSVLPAWRAGRVDAIEALRRRSRAASGGDERWQAALVATQIALVVVLLAGAGLLLRSYAALNALPIGFNPDGVVAVQVQMPPRLDRGDGASRAFMREVQRLAQEKTARPIAIASATPYGFVYDDEAQPEGEGVRPSETVIGLPRAIVSPEYFEVLRIPIIAGRTFAAEDGPQVIIINDVLARRAFGTAQAAGRRLRLGPEQPWLMVVGVTGDIMARTPGDGLGAGAEAYLPLIPGRDNRFLSAIARGDNGPELLRQIKQSIWELDPRLPVIEAATMTEIGGAAVARPRFVLSLTSAFAIAAVVLASVGVYGASAYWVARRRRELAIRLAIGASPSAVARAVVTRSLRVAGVGATAGLAIALAGGRLVESFLFATAPRDPVTLAAVTLLLAGVAVAACLGPAIRAARVDPMTTLRAE